MNTCRHSSSTTFTSNSAQNRASSINLSKAPKLYHVESRVQQRTKCILTGRNRGVVGGYTVARTQIKHFANTCQLFGVRKHSFSSSSKKVNSSTAHPQLINKQQTIEPSNYPNKNTTRGNSLWKIAGIELTPAGLVVWISRLKTFKSKKLKKKLRKKRHKWINKVQAIKFTSSGLFWFLTEEGRREHYRQASPLREAARNTRSVSARESHRQASPLREAARNTRQIPVLVRPVNIDRSHKENYTPLSLAIRNVQHERDRETEVANKMLARFYNVQTDEERKELLRSRVPFVHQIKGNRSIMTETYVAQVRDLQKELAELPEPWSPAGRARKTELQWRIFLTKLEGRLDHIQDTEIRLDVFLRDAERDARPENCLGGIVSAAEYRERVVVREAYKLAIHECEIEHRMLRTTIIVATDGHRARVNAHNDQNLEGQVFIRNFHVQVEGQPNIIRSEIVDPASPFEPKKPKFELNTGSGAFDYAPDDFSSFFRYLLAKLREWWSRRLDLSDAQIARSMKEMSSELLGQYFFPALACWIDPGNQELLSLVPRLRPIYEVIWGLKLRFYRIYNYDHFMHRLVSKENNKKHWEDLRSDLRNSLLKDRPTISTCSYFALVLISFVAAKFF